MAVAQQLSESQLLYQARLNYAQILVFLTGFGGNPTTQQISTFFAALNAMNAGLPPYAQIQGPGQVTHQQGDETYQWTEYQTFIITQMDALRLQQQRADGPFAIATAMRV